MVHTGVSLDPREASNERESLAGPDRPVLCKTV
jgi:hypothetical protein